MLIFSFLKTLKLTLVHTNTHILLTYTTHTTHRLINIHAHTQTLTHTHPHAHTLTLSTHYAHILECQHIPHTLINTRTQTHQHTHTHTHTHTHAHTLECV